MLCAAIKATEFHGLSLGGAIKFELSRNVIMNGLFLPQFALCASS